MCKKTGCCGSLARIILVVVNIIFFLFGAAIFITAAVLKWSGILKAVLDVIEDALKDQVTDVQKALDISLTVFLVLGGIVIFVSLVGLIGSCCANRFFLIIYCVIMSVFFLAHLGVFIYGLVIKGKLEDSLKSEVRKQITILIDKLLESISPSTGVKTLGEQDTIKAIDVDTCKVYREVSRFFECCDFNNNSTLSTIAKDCCASSTYKQDCVDGLFGFLSKYFNIIYIVPNVIVLVLELLIIVSVIVIVKNVNNYNKKKRQNSAYVRTSYDMPVIVTTQRKH